MNEGKCFKILDSSHFENSLLSGSMVEELPQPCGYCLIVFLNLVTHTEKVFTLNAKASSYTLAGAVKSVDRHIRHVWVIRKR